MLRRGLQDAYVPPKPIGSQGQSRVVVVNFPQPGGLLCRVIESAFLHMMLRNGSSKACNTNCQRLWLHAACKKSFHTKTPPPFFPCRPSNTGRKSCDGAIAMTGSVRMQPWSPGMSGPRRAFKAPEGRVALRWRPELCFLLGAGRHPHERRIHHADMHGARVVVRTRHDEHGLRMI